MINEREMAEYYSEEMCSPTSVAIYTPLKIEHHGDKRIIGSNLFSLRGAKRILPKGSKLENQYAGNKTPQSKSATKPASVKRPKALGHYMKTTEASRLRDLKAEEVDLMGVFVVENPMGLMSTPQRAAKSTTVLSPAGKSSRPVTALQPKRQYTPQTANTLHHPPTQTPTKPSSSSGLKPTSAAHAAGTGRSSSTPTSARKAHRQEAGSDPSTPVTRRMTPTRSRTASTQPSDYAQLTRTSPFPYLSPRKDNAPVPESIYRESNLLPPSTPLSERARERERERVRDRDMERERERQEDQQQRLVSAHSTVSSTSRNHTTTGTPTRRDRDRDRDQERYGTPPPRTPQHSTHTALATHAPQAQPRSQSAGRGGIVGHSKTPTPISAQATHTHITSSTISTPMKGGSSYLTPKKGPTPANSAPTARSSPGGKAHTQAHSVASTAKTPIACHSGAAESPQKALSPTSLRPRTPSRPAPTPTPTSTPIRAVSLPASVPLGERRASNRVINTRPPLPAPSQWELRRRAAERGAVPQGSIGAPLGVKSKAPTPLRKKKIASQSDKAVPGSVSAGVSGSVRVTGAVEKKARIDRVVPPRAAPAKTSPHTNSNMNMSDGVIASNNNNNSDSSSNPHLGDCSGARSRSPSPEYASASISCIQYEEEDTSASTWGLGLGPTSRFPFAQSTGTSVWDGELQQMSLLEFEDTEEQWREERRGEEEQEDEQVGYSHCAPVFQDDGANIHAAIMTAVQSAAYGMDGGIRQLYSASASPIPSRVALSPFYQGFEDTDGDFNSLMNQSRIEIASQSLSQRAIGDSFFQQRSLPYESSLSTALETEGGMGMRLGMMSGGEGEDDDQVLFGGRDGVDTGDSVGVSEEEREREAAPSTNCTSAERVEAAVAPEDDLVGFEEDEEEEICVEEEDEDSSCAVSVSSTLRMVRILGAAIDQTFGLSPLDSLRSVDFTALCDPLLFDTPHALSNTHTAHGLPTHTSTSQCEGLPAGSIAPSEGWGPSQICSPRSMDSGSDTESDAGSRETVETPSELDRGFLHSRRHSTDTAGNSTSSNFNTSNFNMSVADSASLSQTPSELDRGFLMSRRHSTDTGISSNFNTCNFNMSYADSAADSSVCAREAAPEMAVSYLEIDTTLSMMSLALSLTCAGNPPLTPNSTPIPALESSPVLMSAGQTDTHTPSDLMTVSCTGMGMGMDQDTSDLSAEVNSGEGKGEERGQEGGSPLSPSPVSITIPPLAGPDGATSPTLPHPHPRPLMASAHFSPASGVAGKGQGERWGEETRSAQKMTIEDIDGDIERGMDIMRETRDETEGIEQQSDRIRPRVRVSKYPRSDSIGDGSSIGVLSGVGFGGSMGGKGPCDPLFSAPSSSSSPFMSFIPHTASTNISNIFHQPCREDRYSTPSSRSPSPSSSPRYLSMDSFAFADERRPSFSSTTSISSSLLSSSMSPPICRTDCRVQMPPSTATTPTPTTLSHLTAPSSPTLSDSSSFFSPSRHSSRPVASSSSYPYPPSSSSSHVLTRSVQEFLEAEQAASGSQSLSRSRSQSQSCDSSSCDSSSTSSPGSSARSICSTSILNKAMICSVEYNDDSQSLGE